MDGPPELHNRIRGQPDAFRKAAAGIEAVAEWRRRLRTALPMQIAIFPITELNIGEAPAAVEALRGLPLDTINIGLRWFVPKDVGTEYESVMRETFGVGGDSWKGFEFDWRRAGDEDEADDGPGPSAEGTEAQAVPRFAPEPCPGPRSSPTSRRRKVPEYFSDFRQTFGHNLCPVAWYFAQVEPDGEVCFCGDFPDYFIGNVRRSPFREIWTGEKATAFREKLAREPLPICNRCCGNFVYGKWERPAASSSGESQNR